MIFELQWKLAFKSLSGRHNASVGPLLQHATIPVIGAYHPKQNAILKNGEGHGLDMHVKALHTKMNGYWTYIQRVRGEADLRHLHVERALVVAQCAYKWTETDSQYSLSSCFFSHLLPSFLCLLGSDLDGIISTLTHPEDHRWQTCLTLSFPPVPSSLISLNI